VQQKRVIAVLRGGHTIGESLEFSVSRIEAVAPSLGRKRRVGDDEVEGFERAVCVLEIRPRKRVVLPDHGGRTVVQNHVHARQRFRGVVHFLVI
jgi:hypothetical protein